MARWRRCWPARDTIALPAGAVLLSPWSDLTGESATTISRASVGPMLVGARIAHGARPTSQGQTHATRSHHRSTPLFADLRGLPPLLVHASDAEELLDDSRLLVERARAAGVAVTLHVWGGLFHVFPIFPTWLPEARKAVAEMASVILAWTSQSAEPRQ